MFLRAELADGPRPAKEVKQAARDADISERTLRRARTRLGVKTNKSEFRGGWEWNLPEGGQPPLASFAEAHAWTPSQEPHEQRDRTIFDSSKIPERVHTHEVDTFACSHDAFWLARDGISRCAVCEPPAFPSEVVA